MSKVWGQIAGISNKFPVDVDTVGEGLHFKDRGS